MCHKTLRTFPSDFKEKIKTHKSLQGFTIQKKKGEDIVFIASKEFKGS